MMIKKILKLKNFGIFYNFNWPEELHSFNKCNLIYGWNRSGKTTISRAFASCEKKSIYDADAFKRYPQIGTFKIETNKGDAVKSESITTNVLPVKVFNEDFIEDNISFDSSESSKPIVYVSKIDIERKKQIESLKKEKIKLDSAYKQKTISISGAEKLRDSFLIDLGREISNALFDKAYNRTKVRNKINEVGVGNFCNKILSDETRIQNEKISKSDERKNIDPFPEIQISFSFNGRVLNNFQEIFDEVEKLLNRKIIAKTLDRLKDDENLNNWVQQGFDLHKTKDEKNICLFCEKPLDDGFLDTLSEHFNDDYKKLQNALTTLKEKILNIKQQRISITNDGIYPHLKDTYTAEAQKLDKCIEKINTWIDKVIIKLEEKYKNPLTQVENPEIPEDFLSSYNQTFGELEKVIGEHKKTVTDHASLVLNARKNIELHLIAIAITQRDYKKMETNIEKAIKEKEDALEIIKTNNVSITDLEKQDSDIGEAINEINKHLMGFFGKEEIKLELDENRKGYKIKRNGYPADSLSEGEKTAIAFSYFIAKISENDFDISTGIIFIDDPISSFDLNFIYHCYSLIKNHFTEVGQIFISTHNFQFFNLVKTWFQNKNENRKNDNKPALCHFFMVENFTNDTGAREAKIVELDKTLQHYKSEYHFLFIKLQSFARKSDVQYEDLYTIGNIARRFFDIFADFKIPTTDDQKTKMDKIVKNIKILGTDVSDLDTDKVYKILNDFSHNSEPTSAIEHKDKNEIQSAIKILLEMIKKSDPKHFEILEKNLPAQ